MALQPFQADPGPLPLIFVSLPDLWDERGVRGEVIEHPKQQGPINITFVNLQALAIHPTGIGQVKMCRQRQHALQEAVEGLAEVVASKLRVGSIQADPVAELLAKGHDELGVHEEVVESLPAKMPRERRHGLGDDLNALTV